MKDKKDRKSRGIIIGAVVVLSLVVFSSGVYAGAGDDNGAPAERVPCTMEGKEDLFVGDPECPELPKTGPVGIAVIAVMTGALAVGGFYFMRSRQELRVVRRK